jgi:hypothetical protein
VPISANLRLPPSDAMMVVVQAPSSPRTVALRRLMGVVWALAFALVVIATLVGQPAWFKWGVQAPVGLVALVSAASWFISRYRDIKAFEDDARARTGSA